MKLRRIALGLAGAMALSFPQGIIAGGPEDIVFTPFGDAYLQIGQIANGWYQNPGAPAIEIYNMWQQQAYAHVGYDALIDKRLDINISVGGSLVYSSPQVIATNDFPTSQSQMQFLINSAYASYPLIEDSHLFSLTLQGGYFPYKYNPDVRNLGEYLFRTNTYPLVVYSSFDYPQVRLLGARVGMQALDSTITDDVLLHSEVLGMPDQDWSIGDIFNVHLFHMLNIGGGVDFTHLLSVYQGPYDPSSIEWYNYYYNLTSSNATKANAVVTDIITNPNGTKDTVSDTLGWRSVKLMGRFSFDPKNMLKNLIDCDIFGKDDFKLYGEADIIGVEDYPKFAEFENRNMRTLFSCGFNIPTFKILDVANVEMEYNADTTSAFSDQGLIDASAGTGPSLFPVALDLPGAVFRNPWRWSIYLKKSVCNGHVSFIAQAARDHTKINFNYWDAVYESYMETLPTSSDWMWAFKTEVKF